MGRKREIRVCSPSPFMIRPARCRVAARRDGGDFQYDAKKRRFVPTSGTAASAQLCDQSCDQPTLTLQPVTSSVIEIEDESDVRQPCTPSVFETLEDLMHDEANYRFLPFPTPNSDGDDKDNSNHGQSNSDGDDKENSDHGHDIYICLSVNGNEIVDKLKVNITQRAADDSQGGPIAKKVLADSGLVHGLKLLINEYL